MDLIYRVLPNYPKDGINFIDLNYVYEHQLNAICDELIENSFDCDAVLAIESRGFITGSVISYAKNKPLIMVRKEKSCLPSYLMTEKFNNEYASSSLGLSNEVLKYKRVIIVDDLIATGNTINKVIELLQSLKIEVVQVLTIIQLSYLNPKIKAPVYYIKEITCNEF